MVLSRMKSWTAKGIYYILRANVGKPCSWKNQTPDDFTSWFRDQFEFHSSQLLSLVCSVKLGLKEQ